MLNHKQGKTCPVGEGYAGTRIGARGGTDTAWLHNCPWLDVWSLAIAPSSFMGPREAVPT